jgi:hypothetical protein
MRQISKTLILVAVAMIMAGSQLGFSEEKVVRARIGILVKSGDQTIRAKSRDRIKAGDLLRIYVQMEAGSHLYVVSRDQKTMKLLNAAEPQIQSSTLILPSSREFYQVDGESPIEIFTVICSPLELKEISLLTSSRMTYDRWVSLEKEWLQKGEIDLARKSEKPFAISGSVRGAGDTVDGDAFVKELPIFSGKSILVRQYEFSVKK